VKYLYSGQNNKIAPGTAFPFLELLTLKRNHKYFEQVQGQMAIIKGSRAYFVVFNFDDVQVIELTLFIVNMELQQRMVLLGHSHVQRLGDFMKSSRYNYLRLQHVSVECLGVSGAWISQQSPKNLANVVHLSVCHNADVVLLHICENDCGKILQNMQPNRSGSPPKTSTSATAGESSRRPSPSPSRALEFSAETMAAPASNAERDDVGVQDIGPSEGFSGVGSVPDAPLPSAAPDSDPFFACTGMLSVAVVQQPSDTSVVVREEGAPLLPSGQANVTVQDEEWASESSASRGFVVGRTFMRPAS